MKTIQMSEQKPTFIKHIAKQMIRERERDRNLELVHTSNSHTQWILLILLIKRQKLIISSLLATWDYYASLLN